MLQEIYDHLPCQRQLNDTERQEAKELLHMKVNKKLLHQDLSEKTGKVVILKDISNIQMEISSKSNGNNIDALVTRLKAIDGMVH